MSAPEPRKPTQSAQILISYLLSSLLQQPVIYRICWETRRNLKLLVYNLIWVRDLLWAKTRVEKENQNIIPTCLRLGPRKSLFTRCSSTQTTKPMKTKNAPVAIHISAFKGFKKIQAFFLSSFLTGTTAEILDSEKGNVKSTYSDRLAKMVTSPTTASYSWFKQTLIIPVCIVDCNSRI